MAAGELQVTDDFEVSRGRADTAQMSEWLTATEAAHYLKVKPRTVLKWAKESRIRGHPLSGSKRITWRFLKSELDAMLALPSAAEHGRVQCATE